MPDELLRPKQAADLLRVTSKQLARYSNTKGLPYEVTPGGHRRYWKSKVEEWNAAQASYRERLRREASERGRQTRAVDALPSVPCSGPEPALNGSGRVGPPARPDPNP